MYIILPNLSDAESGPNIKHPWRSSLLTPSRGVCKSGDVLVSHRVPPAVPSALEGLTSGFGMGPGVSLPPRSPKHY